LARRDLCRILSLSFSLHLFPVAAFVRQLDRARSAEARSIVEESRGGARTSHDKYLTDKLWACSGKIAATTSILRESRSQAITGSSSDIEGDRDDRAERLFSA